MANLVAITHINRRSMGSSVGFDSATTVLKKKLCKALHFLGGRHRILTRISTSYAAYSSKAQPKVRGHSFL